MTQTIAPQTLLYDRDFDLWLETAFHLKQIAIALNNIKQMLGLRGDRYGAIVGSPKKVKMSCSDE